MLALSHDGLRGYTAKWDGTVSVLDVKARKNSSDSVSGSVQRIAISNDDAGFYRRRNRAAPAVIDTEANAVAKWINSMAWDTAAPHADGRFLLIAIPTRMR